MQYIGVIPLKRKNQKVFRGSITPFVVMSDILLEYQSVRCGVIPLKVLHHLGGDLV